MMQARLNIIAAVLFPLVAGCSSQPAETDGSAALRARISSLVGDAPFEVTSFHKTDGQSIEVMGAKGYKLYYTATVSFPSGFKSNCLNRRTDVASFMNNVNCFAEFGRYGDNPVGPQASGAVIAYAGEVDFQKTENRWLVEGVSLKQQ